MVFGILLNNKHVDSVFHGCPIPYPRREFLTDDENEDKADTTKTNNNNNHGDNNHGPTAAKRVRMGMVPPALPPVTSSSSNQGHPIVGPNQNPPLFSRPDPNQMTQNFSQRY